MSRPIISGAEVDRIRRLVYLSTALLTAASVATCGIIGFVGLVVPHAVRILFRPLHRSLLPAGLPGRRLLPRARRRRLPGRPSARWSFRSASSRR